MEEKLLENTSSVNSESAKNTEMVEKKLKVNWKYVIFFVIWLMSAYHLLTVKEKILIKHEILVKPKHTTSMSLQKLH